MVVEEVKKLMEGVSEKIEAIQTKNTDIEKKYDGLRNEEIKGLQEDVLKSAQTAQDLKQAHEAISKQVDEAVALMSRPGAGSSDKDEVAEEYKTAMLEYFRKGKEIDPSISEKVAKQFTEKHFGYESDRSKDMISKTLLTDSNPDGGYLVLPERISGFMIDRTFESSPIRAVANVITTSTNMVEIVIDDNESTSGGWVSEEGERPGTNTAQVGMLEIATHEQYAEPKISRKMLDDSSINIEAWAANKTDDILRRTENTSFVSGNGVAKPKGFLSYDAWAVAGAYERGKIEQLDSGSNGLFTADSIKILQNSLKEPYQSRAVFMVKRASWTGITTLVDDNGAYLLDPRSLKDGDTLRLLGSQVIFADDIPAQATDALAMAYGDFQVGYTIVDRLGIRVLRDPLTDKRYVKYYTTKRVGGAVTNYEAIKLLKLSA
jgi:HK97 family phage major capsid protein